MLFSEREQISSIHSGLAQSRGILSPSRSSDKIKSWTWLRSELGWFHLLPLLLNPEHWERFAPGSRRLAPRRVTQVTCPRWQRTPGDGGVVNPRQSLAARPAAGAASLRTKEQLRPGHHCEGQLAMSLSAATRTISVVLILLVKLSTCEPTGRMIFRRPGNGRSVVVPLFFLCGWI